MAIEIVSFPIKNGDFPFISSIPSIWDGSIEKLPLGAATSRLQDQWPWIPMDLYHGKKNQTIIKSCHGFLDKHVYYHVLITNSPTYHVVIEVCWSDFPVDCDIFDRPQKNHWDEIVTPQMEHCSVERAV